MQRDSGHATAVFDNPRWVNALFENAELAWL